MNAIVFVCVVLSTIVGTSSFIHDRLFPEEATELFAERSQRRLRIRRAVKLAINVRQKRLAASQVSGNIDVFTNLDANKDGFITVPEYRTFNTRELDDDVAVIFKHYDKNSDGKISKNEFFGFLDDINVSSMSSAYGEKIEHQEQMSLSSLSSLSSSNDMLLDSIESESSETSAPPDDCEPVAMRKCDATFLETLDLLQSGDDVFCNGLQAYVRCVLKDIVPCNMDEYVQNVINVVNVYKDTNVCPDADTSSLVSPGSVGRSKRSIKENQTKKERNRLRRVKQAVSPCNIHFVESSRRKNTDFCTILTHYRHCVLHAIRPYKSESVNHLRDGLKYMTMEHRRTHVCSDND